jgi:hypothetical protein
MQQIKRLLEIQVTKGVYKLLTSNHLTMQDAVKLYKVMCYLDSIECKDSIKAIYAEMNKSGFYFSVLEQSPKEINEADYVYKMIEVKYKLCLVKHSAEDKIFELKQLKKWWTIYCMSRKDISYDDWREENVSVSDSSCDLRGMLEACGITIDRINYFQQKFISSYGDEKSYYSVTLVEDKW